MLKQEIGYFDLPENNSGALSTRLSQDALYVKGAVGDSVGNTRSFVTTALPGECIDRSGVHCGAA